LLARRGRAITFRLRGNLTQNSGNERTRRFIAAMITTCDVVRSRTFSVRGRNACFSPRRHHPRPRERSRVTLVRPRFHRHNKIRASVPDHCVGCVIELFFLEQINSTKSCQVNNRILIIRLILKPLHLR